MASEPSAVSEVGNRTSTTSTEVIVGILPRYRGSHVEPRSLLERVRRTGRQVVGRSVEFRKNFAGDEVQVVEVAKVDDLQVETVDAQLLDGGDAVHCLVGRAGNSVAAERSEIGVARLRAAGCLGLGGRG